MKKILSITAIAILSMTTSLFAKCDKCGECKGEDAKAKLEKKFAEFDTDKDGKLSLEEFHALAQACASKCDGGKCEKSKCADGKCEKSKCADGKCETSKCKTDKCEDGKCSTKEMKATPETTEPAKTE